MINFEVLISAINLDKMRVISSSRVSLFCILSDVDNATFVCYNDKGEIFQYFKKKVQEAELFLYTEFRPITVDFNFEDFNIPSLSIN